MKIFDCFLYNDEDEMLNLRMDYLNDVVDYFVIVEGCRTFDGKEKLFRIEQNAGIIEKYGDKILYVQIGDFPDITDRWGMQHYSRDMIMKALADTAQDDDIIMLSDIDEIPRKELVGKHIGDFQMKMYQYWLNWLDERELWFGTVALPYRTFKDIPTHKIRLLKGTWGVKENAGWHFTYMCGLDMVYKKLRVSSDDRQDSVGMRALRKKEMKQTSMFKVVPMDDYPDNIGQYKHLFWGENVDISKALGIDGWMMPEELTWLAEQAKTHKHILEIGAYKGRSTRALADNTDGKVVTIDPFIKSPYRDFYENMRDHITNNKVAALNGISHEVLKWPGINNTKFDTIFIDGSHEYADVKQDVLNCLPLLAPGGLLCGHDYYYVKKGVTEALGHEPNVAVESIWFVEGK